VAGIRLRDARRDEGERLSALALRSKAHWGYSDEFLAACRAELTFDPGAQPTGRMRVAEEDRRVLGFSLVEGEPPHGELAALFVDPTAIGTGCGGLLLRDALDGAARAGFRSLILDADPGAEPFYLHLGAHRIGESPSGSIAGRMLPRLEFRLPRVP
jgi:GNAT superfamily N-acetyltransferase